MTDVKCRKMFTRVCPRSLPDGCAPARCMRFEITEQNLTPEDVGIWEEHHRITSRVDSNSPTY
jgi:hypothetical protein